MKNKSPLVLIEQIMMVLVFALAAAFCLRAFVLADTISVKNQQKNDGALLAQNAAETLKSCGGDYDAAAQLLGGDWDGACWELQQDGLTLSVKDMESGIAGLGKAELQVVSSDGALLFAIETAWQEVNGRG